MVTVDVDAKQIRAWLRQCESEMNACANELSKSPGLQLDLLERA